jgi:hypothetical protein
MHSSDRLQYIKGSDLTMLRRILDAAGLPEHADPSGRGTRDKAARLLITLFEQGIAVESKLTEALRASLAAPSHEPPSPPIVNTAGGYRYGRRVERNGTWTIYHVFSGIPAEYASWKMVGLNVKTAERALKILNAPASARPAA